MVSIEYKFNKRKMFVFFSLFFVSFILTTLKILIGPLQHGMIVTNNLLPMLVRLTAINASEELKKLTEYVKPYCQRLRTIQDISERFKVEKLFSDYFSDLIPSPLKKSVSEEELNEESPNIIVPTPSPPKSGVVIGSASPKSFSPISSSLPTFNKMKNAKKN